MFKDVQLGIEIASRLDLDLPATSAVGGVMYGAVMKSWGDLDYAAVAKLYEDASATPKSPAGE
jgi:3-hydroxyisobutyrate dehydrogenase-like beta-hydroxyacid dehydrogenase